MKKLLAAVTAFLLLFSCATFASADETEGVFVPTYQAFMNAFVPKIEIINADYADAIREECFVDGKWVEPSSSYGDIYYYYLATDLRIREGNGFLNYLYIDLPKDHIGKEEDVFKQLILAAATSIIPDADEEFKQTFFESIYYDYAKIYQCIYGLYDFIIEDRFNLNNKNNEIIFDIEKPNNIKKIEQSFLKILLNEIKEDIDVIKLLEAIQFFAMTPAHNDNTNRQIVQICVGISHFVDVIGEVQ